MMLRATLIAALLLAMLLCISGTVCSATQEPKSDPDLSRVSDLIIRLANEFRKQEGRREVKGNAKLAETVRYFADYMASTDKYGYTADGDQPSERAKKHGYQFCVIAENITYEYKSTRFTTEELAKGFFEGWKKSPEHRKNMLDSDVTETGVAVARSNKTGHYYAVQMFGRPESDHIKFQITNRSGLAVKYEAAGEKFLLPPDYSRTHTQCRSTELSFLGPEKENSDQKNAVQKIIPQNGDRYAVVRDGSGKVQMCKE
jgi:uncharacterized protein YkwD